MYSDPSAEWRWLSAALESPQWVTRVKETLFTHERISVFRAFEKLIEKDNLITSDGVESLLGYYPGELDVGAGAGDISQLTDKLAQLAKKRQYLDKSKKLEALSREQDPKEDDLKSIVAFDPVVSIEDGSMAIGCKEGLATLKKKRDHQYDFIRTGLKFLNHKIGGEYKPGSLTLILGASGAGKTTFILNSAYRMALLKPEPIPSIIFSFEMSKEDLFYRMLADRLGINYKLIVEGERLTPEQVESIESASIELQRLPMYVIDNPDLSLKEIIYNIRRFYDNFHIKAVFIDYLQIVNYDNGNRIKDLGKICKTLRDLAKELQIAIIMLSQVTDDNDGMYRVRESREPTHISDVIMEIILEESSPNDPGRCGQLVLYKNRYGPLGAHAIIFYGKYQRFDGADED